MTHSDFLAHFITDAIYLVDDSSSRQDRSLATPAVPYLAVTSGKLDAQGSHLLDKILSSIPLTREQINIVESVEVTPQGYRLIFWFGPPPGDVLLEPYRPVEINGQKWLLADSLPDLDADTAKKRQLWNILKDLFR